MKSCLYTPCYLEGMDALGNNRLERNQRYIKYYLNIKKELGFQEIWLADNASDHKLIQSLKMPTLDIIIHRFNDHLPRGEGPNPYPYCWRALYFIRRLISLGYQKIICIDSDSFILSRGLADYIRYLNSGWTTFWSQKYSFPTAECHIICEDAFPKLLEFTSVPMEHHYGKLMEEALPFTYINPHFKCDRWGETDEPVTEDMDGYFQARLTMPLEFRKPTCEG